jgi:hypothetical protein
MVMASLRYANRRSNAPHHVAVRVQTHASPWASAPHCFFCSIEYSRLNHLDLSFENILSVNPFAEVSRRLGILLYVLAASIRREVLNLDLAIEFAKKPMSLQI